MGNEADSKKFGMSVGVNSSLESCWSSASFASADSSNYQISKLLLRNRPRQYGFLHHAATVVAAGHTMDVD